MFCGTVLSGTGPGGEVMGAPVRAGVPCVMSVPNCFLENKLSTKSNEPLSPPTNHLWTCQAFNSIIISGIP